MNEAIGALLLVTFIFTSMVILHLISENTKARERSRKFSSAYISDCFFCILREI